jgi:hypothetical protein
MEIKYTEQLFFILETSWHIMHEIRESRTEKDLQTLLEHPEIRKHVMNKDRYHQLNLSISKDQLLSYFSSGLLRDDGSINESKLIQESAATQLLYAFIWKAGDIQKVKYIVQGILNVEPVPYSGMVLYYFGKHLADKNHPIVDQHVIRAFSMATNRSRFNEDVLKRKDFENIQAYLHWFQNELSPEISNSAECRYLVDQVLYALGKRIKEEVAIQFPKIYANR